MTMRVYRSSPDGWHQCTVPPEVVRDLPWHEKPSVRVLAEYVDHIEICFLTGGRERQSFFSVRIDLSSFAELAKVMMACNPLAAEKAFLTAMLARNEADSKRIRNEMQVVTRATRTSNLYEWPAPFRRAVSTHDEEQCLRRTARSLWSCHLDIRRGDGGFRQG